MLTSEERDRIYRRALQQLAVAQYTATLNVLTPGCYGALVLLATRYAGQK